VKLDFSEIQKSSIMDNNKETYGLKKTNAELLEELDNLKRRQFELEKILRNRPIDFSTEPFKYYDEQLTKAGWERKYPELEYLVYKKNAIDEKYWTLLIPKNPEILTCTLNLNDICIKDFVEFNIYEIEREIWRRQIKTATYSLELKAYYFDAVVSTNSITPSVINYLVDLFYKIPYGDMPVCLISLDKSRVKLISNKE
jgi:hypothetical protein